MRQTGRLQRWHDDRGFGFIAPRHGTAEIFVHISAFPLDGSRPTVGEQVEYELARGQDGRPQAIQVKRLALGGSTRPGASPRARPESAGGLLGKVLTALLILALGSVAYRWYEQRAQRLRLESMPVPTSAPRPSAPSGNTTAGSAVPSYQCDGRIHCSQMTSCAEATWFLNHCPGTRMDGDHDGIPCEQQLCTGPGAR